VLDDTDPTTKPGGSGGGQSSRVRDAAGLGGGGAAGTSSPNDASSRETGGTSSGVDVGGSRIEADTGIVRDAPGASMIDTGSDVSGDAAVADVGVVVDAALGPSRAVTFQINPAHDGSQLGDDLRLPLARRWAHDFGTGPVSYPLIAEGRVFVTVANAHVFPNTNGSFGSSLYALDAANGSVLWGPVSLGGQFGFWSNAALENDRIFTVNNQGVMSAFEAATGNPIWSHQLPFQYSFSSPPTALGGVVYVGGAGDGGTLYAVDERDGAVRWSASVQNGDDSSPAVSASGVFVSYACNQAYAFAQATGAPLWHHTSDCEGGGGKTVALFGDSIFTRDFEGDLILDKNTGMTIGSFFSDFMPVLGRGMGYFVRGGTLSAIRLDTRDSIWSYGNAMLTNAPILVGGHVVGGSSTGYLDVMDAATGDLEARDALGEPLPGPGEGWSGGPITGLAAAGGLLVVPLSTSLIAY